MNGVCHCEWEGLVLELGNVFEHNVNSGIKMAATGAEVTSDQTVASHLEKVIKMCNFCRCSLHFCSG